MDGDDTTRGPNRGLVLPRADGTRVEVSEPFGIGDEWVCVAKLVGREHELPWLGEEPRAEVDDEVTHTLFMARGRGTSPEQAVRDAMNQVEQSTTRTSLKIQTKTEPPARHVHIPPRARARQARLQASRIAAAAKRAEPRPTPPDPPPPPAPPVERGWLARFFGTKKTPKPGP